MPNFKPKSNKTIKYNKKTAVTLDNKHKEFLNDFMKDDYNTIPELKMERQEIQNKINSGEVSLEARLDMEDQIKALTERIKGLKTKKKEYFLDNSKYIFEYFENKKDISVGNKAVASTNKSKIVNSFFKIRDEPVIDNTAHIENSNIVQKYLSNIDDMFIDVNSFVYQTDICKVCHVGELIPLEDEGVLVCNNCSRSIPYLIENEKLNIQKIGITGQPETRLAYHGRKGFKVIELWVGSPETASRVEFDFIKFMKKILLCLLYQ